MTRKYLEYKDLIYFYEMHYLYGKIKSWKIIHGYLPENVDDYYRRLKIELKDHVKYLLNFLHDLYINYEKEHIQVIIDQDIETFEDKLARIVKTINSNIDNLVTKRTFFYWRSVTPLQFIIEYIIPTLEKYGFKIKRPKIASWIN